MLASELELTNLFGSKDSPKDCLCLGLLLAGCIGIPGSTLPLASLGPSRREGFVGGSLVVRRMWVG